MKARRNARKKLSFGSNLCQKGVVEFISGLKFERSGREYGEQENN